MADQNITQETSISFNDNTAIDIGISNDKKKVVLIVQHPSSSRIESSVSCQIRVELNIAEANKLFEVIKSKIQLLES